VSALDSTRASDPHERTLGAWMRGNLTTQGYCLSEDERRRLSIALRFSTGTCLLLVVTALVLESSAMIFALSGIGLIAGFARRHPFDLVWNHGVRHLTSGRPALPPNPTRRSHAFKIATLWLLAVGALLAAGATTAGLVLGGLLVAACATVTTTNFCIPSELFAWWERRAGRRRLGAT
jgi:hypothetical protein